MVLQSNQKFSKNYDKKKSSGHITLQENPIASKDLGIEEGSEGIDNPRSVTRGSTSKSSMSSESSIEDKCEAGGVACEVANPSGLDFSITPYIHWIQGTLKTLDSSVLGRLKKVVEDTAKSDGLIWRGQGARRGVYFKNSIRFSCGSLILWNEPDKESGQPFHIWFSISGEACERAGLYGAYQLIMAIESLKNVDRLSFTRIDVKVRLGTGWKTKFNLVTIKNCASAEVWESRGQKLGNFTGYESYKVIESGMLEPDNEAFTIYFGSDKSYKKTRFYDPKFLHGVEGIDIESELKDRTAMVIASLFSDLGENPDPELVASLVASWAIGQVDFVDRSKSDRACRCPRFGWWQELIDASSGALRVSAPRKSKTFQKTIKWIDKQVIQSLTAICCVFPEAWTWLSEKMDKACLNFSPEIQSLINEAVKNNLTFADIT